MNKRLRSALLLSTALTVLAGCTAAPETSKQNDNASTTKSENNELFIFTAWPSFYQNEEMFEKQVGQHLKAKFPGITIKHMHWDKDKGRDYKDLFDAENYPDIIVENTRPALLRTNEAYPFFYDMSDLIKKFNFDTSNLNQAALAKIRNLTAQGETVALPFQLSDFVMFYNLDLFSKYNVEVPKDGMTYDEVYELAKKLTHLEGDEKFKGYQQHPGLYLSYNQLSLSPLSPTEDKVDIANDGWIKLVDNLRRFYEIPGNDFKSVDDFPNGKTAIAVHVSEKIIQWYNQNPNLNFDIAAMPSFSDVPMTKAQPNMYSLFITKQSKNKDLAFQAIAHLLSEEIQMEFAKEAIIGPLESENVHAVFGQSLPQMQGKNVQAIFHSKNALPPAARADHLTNIDVPVNDIFGQEIFKNNADTLAALKAVENRANEAIQKAKMDQKNKEANAQQQ